MSTQEGSQEATKCQEAAKRLRPALESLLRNEKELIKALQAKGYPSTWLFGVRRGIQATMEILEA